MYKVDIMQESMGNVSRKMEILRKKKKCQRSKYCNRNEKYLHGFLGRLDMAEERISVLNNVRKPLKLKSKENKDWKNKTKYPRTVG